MIGGAGENASPMAVLAEYDRLGGLVRLDGRTIKTGSFYDFDGKAPRKSPEVTLILRDLEGNVVEISADEELSPELKASETIQKRKAKERDEKIAEGDEKRTQKAEAKKKKASKATEDEE